MTVRPAAKIRNRQTTWYVPSETTPGVNYIVHHKRDVTSHRLRWTCNCPDFAERRQFNGTFCKHIVEVQTFQASQAAIAAAQAPNAGILGDAMQTQATLSVRQMIDTLVAKLNGPDGRELWAVISALRGPDSDDSRLKDDTTATLRAAIGLKHDFLIVNAKYRPLGLNEYIPCRNQYYEGNAAIRAAVERIFPNVQNHFLTHYREALRTLVKLGYIK